MLGPVGVDGTEITKAEAILDTTQGSGWKVVMNFDSKGEKKFTDVTTTLSSQTSPQNQFAIVLDDEVVSTPRSTGPSPAARPRSPAASRRKRPRTSPTCCRTALSP